MIFNAGEKKHSILDSLPEYCLHHRIFIHNKYPYAISSELSSETSWLFSTAHYLEASRLEINAYIAIVNASPNLVKRSKKFDALINELDHVASRTSGKRSVLIDLTLLCRSVLEVRFILIYDIDQREIFVF